MAESHVGPNAVRILQGPSSWCCSVWALTRRLDQFREVNKQLLATDGDNPIFPLGFVVLSALCLLYTEVLATNK